MSYKLLVGIYNFRCSWRQRWTDEILKSKGQRSRSENHTGNFKCHAFKRHSHRDPRRFTVEDLLVWNYRVGQLKWGQLTFLMVTF